MFNSYAVFLAVAQTLEDTGVRAYKGATPDLMSSPDVLEAALRIHSVEARHAAHLRQMRQNLHGAVTDPLKPWITSKNSGITAPYGQYVQASYDGEENYNQAGINLTNISDFGPISPDVASESFDEPLTMAQVIAIVDPFIV